jgi:hypothetical protein
LYAIAIAVFFKKKKLENTGFAKNINKETLCNRYYSEEEFYNNYGTELKRGG